MNVESLSFENIRKILEKFNFRIKLEEIIIKNFHLKHIVIDEESTDGDETIYNQKVNEINLLVNEIIEKNPELRFIIEFKAEKNEKLILTQLGCIIF